MFFSPNKNSSSIFLSLRIPVLVISLFLSYFPSIFLVHISPSFLLCSHSFSYFILFSLLVSFSHPLPPPSLLITPLPHSPPLPSFTFLPFILILPSLSSTSSILTTSHLLHQVGWLRTDTQTILSLHKKVVTHNTRISVTHSEPRTWNLHIRSVSCRGESNESCWWLAASCPLASTL